MFLCCWLWVPPCLLIFPRHMLTQSCFQAPLEEGGCSQAPVQYLSNSDPNDAAFSSQGLFSISARQDWTGFWNSPNIHGWWCGSNLFLRQPRKGLLVALMGGQSSFVPMEQRRPSSANCMCLVINYPFQLSCIFFPALDGRYHCGRIMLNAETSSPFPWALLLLSIRSHFKETSFITFINRISICPVLDNNNNNFRAAYLQV